MWRTLGALSLLLATACSHGGAPPDDENPGADMGTEVDLLAPADLSSEQPGFLRPAWVWTLQGGLTSWGPHLSALPGSGESAVVLAFTKGYEADELTVGKGDPGETLVKGKFKPVLAWFSGRDGRVLRVRQVAADQSPTQRASVLPQAGVSVAPDGAVVTGGQFHGTAIFNPGTASEQRQATQSRLVGDTLHRAEDPFHQRYAADGTPGWYFRGTTPGPLTKTWFNYGQGTAALEDGGAVIAGLYEDSGLVLGAGRPGAVTLMGGGGSYLARITPQGGLAWVLRNTGSISFWNGVRALADGSSYVLVPQGGSAVLGADGPKIALPVPAGQRAYSLLKLGPGGELRWARRFLTAGQPGPSALVVTADGRALLAGRADGEMSVRSEADRVEAMVPGSGARAFAASLTPDGAVTWMTVFGTEIDQGIDIAPRADGGAWLLASTSGKQRAVPLDDGGMARLPDGLKEEDQVPLLYRLDAAGKRRAVYVLGVNLPASKLVGLTDGGVAVAGGYGDWATDVRVGAPEGTRALPLCTSKQDQLLFVVALRP